MNILVINGSPKGEKSNTLKLTKTFLEGMEMAGKNHIEIITLSDMRVESCKGCFACWNKTPGLCVIKDDMRPILEKLIAANIVIWSFPLYYYLVPGMLKNLIDRQLPLNLPFMAERADGLGSGSHLSRYDLNEQRSIVISTCGFYSAEGNYDGVRNLFDHIYGKGKYETVFCGQGELFGIPELKKTTGAYLESVKRAGAEYMSGGIAPETRSSLTETLFPKETFEEMADASWGVARINDKAENPPDETFTFVKQMASLYRPSSSDGKEKVLEFYFTDRYKTYQIVLNAEGHKVLTERSLPFTTRIETPFTVWRDIARGDISGQDALMQGLYRVTGDFDLMIRWDDYFSGGNVKSEARQAENPLKKTDMRLLLPTWIALWVLLPINSVYGAIAGIACAALLPLASLRFRLTPYDGISGATVTAISLAAIFHVNPRPLLSLSYGLFGAMWFVSLFLKVPLSAWYSKNSYGGEKALQNPLFVHTNRILTLCWAVLYALTPIWTWFLMGTSFSSLSGAINSLAPALLGAFTVWFQKWYPARYASGKSKRK